VSEQRPAGSTLLARLWDWYQPPTPLARLQLLRIGIGGYALVYLLTRAAHLNAVVDLPAGSFAPVGVVRWLDAPLAAGWVYALYAAALVAGAAFTLGVGYRACAPLFALLLLWVLSYRHSWGMIFHTDNLLVLHVLLLALAPAGGAPRRSLDAPAVTAYGWVPRVMALVTVASYVVAGVAKLEHTGWSWAGGAALREQVAYDAIRKIELGSTYSPIGTWLVPHAGVFAPLSAFSLATELLAPLALLGTRVALVWCACAWSFHAGVLALMAIAFPYPLSGCAFLPLFPVERALPWLERAFGRMSRARRPSASAPDAPQA
jgi:vitamin K-dependent gamma-carboxylase-like protein